MLGAVDGQNRLVKHELCAALKVLESLVRCIEGEFSHLADRKVYYRMLMAVNIFKNVKEKISDVEREQAQSGLFPTAEQYVEETAYLVADVVSQIRSFVGLKQLHEIIASSWSRARSHKEALSDPVHAGHSFDVHR
ncbi:unnamed protein product [Heligmosomoides polygyrus]|uniref:Uncharacterized protein n=1 Tax=Heligmosomoides polygyrus TaxID=6339 RepID=A0A3P8EER3_HELPZ|nr:unnamed protein product [Heligmosomoides polygyrus]